MVDPEATILELLSRHGPIEGKKAFQKLVYFVQEGEGLPLGLSFRMMHYGPYSTELEELTAEMEESGILSVQRSANGGFRLQAKQEVRPSDASPAIESVLQRIGNEGGLTLELLATIHFLSRGPAPADDSRLIRRVKAWKGTKFNEGFILTNINKLRRLGYV